MRYLATALAFLLLVGAEARAQGIILDRIIVEDPSTPPPLPPERRPPARWPMRLLEHQVDIRIEDQAVQTRLTQVFHNPNAWPMEGVYLFPLPDGASVSRFTMSMGGKQIPGELLEADKAREIYRSIVHRREDPGLLEYAGRRLIRARLFPIPARGDTKVELSYEQVLEPVGGVIEMVYPLRTDKFAPGLVKTSGTIDVKAQAGVATVFSPSHKLDVVRKSGTHAVASFEETGEADRDLHVLYGLGRKDFGVSLATHKPGGEDGYFLLLLSPNVPSDGAALPRDVVFVVDTSGSMGDRGGAKMRQAKGALSYALGRLDARDRFNVISFATEARAFRQRPVEATPENVQAAVDFVQGLEATGGTAIHEALLKALELERTDGRVPLVFFLTDGEATIGPTDTEAILGAVERTNRAQARLFVFGVGDDVNSTLLTELSDKTRGAAHFVTERENIELKVSALVDKVASPVLTDVRLDLAGATVLDVFPRTPGDLFKGQQLTVLGRYKGAGAHAITLKGRVGAREVTFVYEATFDGGTERGYLPRLWAVRKVGFLLDEIRRNGESKELVEEIRRLGTRHGIVTPYTSFLVVDERELAGRRFDLPGGAGGGAPAAELRRAREERDSILQALEGLGDDMAFAEEALGKKQEAGKGAVAGARVAVRYGRAEQDEGAVGVKTVGGKTFRLVDGVWTDLALDEGGGDAEVVRVRYLSDEYDGLLEDAKLARLLSVGTRVRVLHGGRVYEITE